MWEVVAKSRISGRERRVVTVRWERASELARKALDCGWKVRVKRYFTDILIADSETGDFFLVASRVDPQEAANWTHGYAKIDRLSGCTLWPHGSPMPKGWNVIRA